MDPYSIITCQKESKQPAGACPNIRSDISSVWTVCFCVFQAMSFYPSTNMVHSGNIYWKIIFVLSSILCKLVIKQTGI